MSKIVLFLDSYQKNHQSFYQNLAGIFSINSDIDIIICNPINLDENAFKNATLHIIDKDENLYLFIRSKKHFLKQADLIIFEEFYRFHFPALLQVVLYGYKSLQIIHNTNKYLKRTLKLNLKSLVGYVVFKIIKGFIRGVIVVSQTVKEYIIKGKLFSSNNVFYIPFNDISVKYNQKKDANLPVKFTIPGTIDRKSVV